VRVWTSEDVGEIRACFKVTVHGRPCKQLMSTATRLNLCGDLEPRSDYQRQLQGKRDRSAPGQRRHRSAQAVISASGKWKASHRKTKSSESLHAVALQHAAVMARSGAVSLHSRSTLLRKVRFVSLTRHEETSQAFHATDAVQPRRGFLAKDLVDSCAR